MLARGESLKSCSHPAGGVSPRKAPAYRARGWQENPLSRIVQNNLSEFEQWLRNPPDPRRPRPHPSIITALEKLIECGVMRFGAVRFRCPDCGHDIFVAFSCKRRGLCPSCDAKRAAVAADAADRLLPPVPYRQWVLVIPKRLRWYINQRPDLAGELSRIFAGEINRFLRKNADGAPAQLHFIQRFGGALNLHIHVHAVVSDGVFSARPGFAGRRELSFTPVPGPTEDQLAGIVSTIRRKLIRRLRRIGGLGAEAAEDMLSWKNPGFSLHKEVCIRGGDRAGLERLLYYCSRPALSLARLAYSVKGSMVIYRTEMREGRSRLLAMTPVEFLRRWGLLMPPPHKNLIHFYGALGPRSPLRPLLTAKTSSATARVRLKAKVDFVMESAGKQARSWAACLARVFEVTPLICPNCRKELVPVAVITNDRELVRLLKYLELPTEFPKIRPAPRSLDREYPPQATGPPDDGCQLDPRADLYERIDSPAPAD